MSHGLEEELAGLLDRAIGVDGVLLASADGLLVASAAVDAEPDTLAALCSATAGLSTQFAGMLDMSPVTTTVIQAAGGCIAVHPLPGTAILLLYTRDPANVALLHLAVRQTSVRLLELLAVDRTADVH